MNRTIWIILILIVTCTSVSAALNETGDTSALITSSTPQISTIELNDASLGDDSITLTAGNITLLNCQGTATDSDGLADIENVTARIFGPSSTEESIDFDDNHYSNFSCSFDNSTGDYNCGFNDVQFYAENGTWTCVVNVSDFAANSNESSDVATMEQLLAIDIPDATVVDFGTVGVGGSGVEQSVNLENEGNVAIDVEVDVYRDNNDTTDNQAMNCSVGTIPTANINASLTAGSSYSLMLGATILSLNANLAEATGNDQSPTTETVYLTVELPPGGIAGTCDGTIFFGATLS